MDTESEKNNPIKAKCPKCGSEKIENYAVTNIAKDINKLEFNSIMVVCDKQII
jgi:hypothetical protein